ncbi:hypothetical protein [Halococcus agarilyticus]|uniref:hypothetical protein n=1 Tax=Halococcus agarilyticus TaxID=1232219 RepID=UPI00067772EB|nr:hypothetical protein [Halococcus agarilyticus]
MDRRRFVAAFVIGSAGCLSGSPPGGIGTNDRGSTTERRTTTTETVEPTTIATTTEPTATGTDTEPTEAEPTDATELDTDTPGTRTEDQPDLRAAPGDCPEYGDDVVKVICYDVAPDDAPMVMEPSRSSLDLPGEMAFTLHNGTDGVLQTNFYSARLHKRVGGEWYLVAPQGWPEPLTPLPAGESQTWTVSMSNDPEESKPNVDEARLAVGGLGGGRYAFGIDGNFRGGTYERSTAFAATIEIRGDPVKLTTTDAVEDVSVEGDVLTASWTGGNAEGEYAREATYVLERADKTPDVHLITEQVLQGRLIGQKPLRDALALATNRDVPEVRLTGQTASSPPFGVDYRVIGYEGTAYGISASETGTETES